MKRKERKKILSFLFIVAAKQPAEIFQRLSEFFLLEKSCKKYKK